MTKTPRIFDENEARELLRQACKKAGSASEWSRQNGVTKAFVSGVLSGLYPPTTAVMTPLGMKKKVLWELDGDKNVG